MNPDHILSVKNTEELYNALNIDYPKFYKMDALSQLGIVLSEQLVQSVISKNTGIIAWNSHSSYQADIKHLENNLMKLPGPANFSYTLPNISLSEIAIRHRMFGETAIHIKDRPDFEEMESFIQMYFEQSSPGQLFTGYLDSGPDGTGGFLCEIRKVDSSETSLAKGLKSLYDSLFL